MLLLDLPSGWVTATIFLIFDVILLAVIDIIFSYVAAQLYYRQIRAGHPIYMQSADIPGVTANLLGDPRSLVNLCVIIIKLILLAMIFYVNFGVRNAHGFSFSSETRTAVYSFNPSDAMWSRPGLKRAVQRRGEIARLGCNTVLTHARVQFHQLAFNLSGGAIVRNETDHGDRKFPVHNPSILCLSPDRVRDAPPPVMSVVGCSRLGPSSSSTSTTTSTAAAAATAADARDENTSSASDCNRLTNLRRRVTLPTHGIGKLPLPFPDGSNVTYRLEIMNSSSVGRVFPEYAALYTKLQMVFLGQCIGLNTSCCRRRAARVGAAARERCQLLIEPGILVASNATHTLVERWEVDERDNAAKMNMTLLRPYAGAVLHGQVDIGINRMASVLLNIKTHSPGWMFAGALMAQSLVYEYQPTTYVLQTREKRTMVAQYSVVIGGLVVTAVACAAVTYAIARRVDDPPRFNTIDGLSSIIRAELHGDENAMTEGRTAVKNNALFVTSQ